MANTADATDYRTRLEGRAGVPYDEAAEIIGAHVNTIRRLVKRGALESYQLGRVGRIRSGSIVDFLERGGAVEIRTDD